MIIYYVWCLPWASCLRGKDAVVKHQEASVTFRTTSSGVTFGPQGLTCYVGKIRSALSTGCFKIITGQSKHVSKTAPASSWMWLQHNGSNERHVYVIFRCSFHSLRFTIWSWRSSQDGCHGWAWWVWGTNGWRGLLWPHRIRDHWLPSLSTSPAGLNATRLSWGTIIINN